MDQEKKSIEDFTPQDLNEARYAIVTILKIGGEHNLIDKKDTDTLLDALDTISAEEQRRKKWESQGK